MIYIPYANSLTYHAASIRKSQTNRCKHFNIGSGVILRTFGHDPVLRVFALCTSLRPAPICVRFTARIHTRATLFRRVDVSNSVSSSTRHYARYVKALLGGPCLSGGSGEIHSGHPWPSPFGQLRCAHRQSCRCVELDESIHPPLPPDRQKPPFGGPCLSGGSGEIRTHGGLTPTAVFKTAALNHSATLP